MAIDKITFIDYSEPAICAPWLNLVSDVIWDGLGQNTSPEAILDFIGGAPVSHQHDHADTLNRDAVDAHPISSITDLQTTLDAVAVPPGGATGQHLSKASDADQDTEWVDAAGAGPHNALSDRDAADSHPIVAITGLQADLDDRYTESEVDGMIAGLQDQIDTQQAAIDLQPILVEDVDVTGRDLYGNPLVFDLDLGYAYEISGFVRSTPGSTSLGLRLSNPDDSIIISANYRFAYQRFGSILSDSSGSNVAANNWFLTTVGTGAATVFTARLNLDASLLSNCVFSSEFGGYNDTVGYLTGTSGGALGGVSGPPGGRINVLTIDPGVTASYGRIQVYQLPRIIVLRERTA